jgi:hypothetical protein
MRLDYKNGWLLLVLSAVLLSGCQPPRPDADGYYPLSSLVKRGFARDRDYVRNLDGRTIRVKGYLDFANIAVDPALLDKPVDGWDIPRDGESSHFDLKARASDEAGESIRVWLVEDSMQFRPLFAKLGDIVADDRRNALIRVQGKVKVFEAPTNFVRLVGFVINVESPEQVDVD